MTPEIEPIPTQVWDTRLSKEPVNVLGQRGELITAEAANILYVIDADTGIRQSSFYLGNDQLLGVGNDRLFFRSGRKMTIRNAYTGELKKTLSFPDSWTNAVVQQDMLFARALSEQIGLGHRRSKTRLRGGVPIMWRCFFWWE